MTMSNILHFILNTLSVIWVMILILQNLLAFNKTISLPQTLHILLMALSFNTGWVGLTTQEIHLQARKYFQAFHTDE